MTKRELYIKLVSEAILDLDAEQITAMRLATDWKWHGGETTVEQTRIVIREFLDWALGDTKDPDWQPFSIFVRYSAGFWIAVTCCDDPKAEYGCWIKVFAGWGPTGGNDDGEAYAV
jgi:hypothetical protein